MDSKCILIFSPAGVAMRSPKVAIQPPFPNPRSFFFNNWNKEHSNIRSRHLFNKTCWCLQMKLRILYFLEWYIAFDIIIFENILELKGKKWKTKTKKPIKWKENNPQTIPISINWMIVCFLNGIAWNFHLTCCTSKPMDLAINKYIKHHVRQCSVI